MTGAPAVFATGADSGIAGRATAEADVSLRSAGFATGVAAWRGGFAVAARSGLEASRTGEDVELFE